MTLRRELDRNNVLRHQITQHLSNTGANETHQVSHRILNKKVKVSAKYIGTYVWMIYTLVYHNIDLRVEGNLFVYLGKKETQVQIFKYWKFVCEQTDLVFCIWWH